MAMVRTFLLMCVSICLSVIKFHTVKVLGSRQSVVCLSALFLGHHAGACVLVGRTFWQLVVIFELFWKRGTIGVVIWVFVILVVHLLEVQTPFVGVVGGGIGQVVA